MAQENKLLKMLLKDYFEFIQLQTLVQTLRTPHSPCPRRWQQSWACSIIFRFCPPSLATATATAAAARWFRWRRWRRWQQQVLHLICMQHATALAAQYTAQRRARARPLRLRPCLTQGARTLSAPPKQKICIQSKWSEIDLPLCRHRHRLRRCRCRCLSRFQFSKWHRSPVQLLIFVACRRQRGDVTAAAHPGSGGEGGACSRCRCRWTWKMIAHNWNRNEAQLFC